MSIDSPARVTLLGVNGRADQERSDPPWPDCDVAAALPDDALDARVAAVAFLRASGRRPPPVVIGGYELVRTLGGGGFGRVYLARQPSLDRDVALKLLHRGNASLRADWVRREARALAQLSHPNVVQVYEVASALEGAFIVMEYIDGVTLREWQRDRTGPEVLVAYLQAGAGLAAAHERGVLHLDFKPTNVLVGADGRARVADFGLSAGASISDRAGDDTPATAGSVATTSRVKGGTAGYASPEQACGLPIDERSDQFSYCAALHEAMHGVLPFTPAEIVAMAVVGARPTPAKGPRPCPRWLRRVIRRGLRPEPRDRWPSMSDLLDAIGSRPFHRRVRGVAIVGVVVASITAAAAASPPQPCEDAVLDLAPRWDPTRRAALDRALVGQGNAWTPALRASILRTLDTHAERAQEVARSACALEGRDGESRRGLECVARERDRFEGFISILSNGDVATSARADRLLAEFDATPCDGRGTSGTSAVGGDARLVRELDLIRLQITAGDLDAVTHRVDEVVDAASRPAVVAEAHLVRAIAQDVAGRHDDALSDLDDAGTLALSVGRDDLAAEAWRRASRIAAYDLADLPRAQRWSRLAGAALARIGRPPLAAAEQLDTEGIMARVSGDPVAAESRHRNALEHLARVLERDHPRWSETSLLLAHALADQGRWDDARGTYGDALVRARASLGDAHPRVATLLFARALVARDADADTTALDEALRDLAQAEEIMAAAPGHDPAWLASALTLRAELQLRRGLLDDARVAAAQAWQLQQAHLPLAHPERGSALGTLARIALAEQAWEEALRLHLAYASEREPLDDEAALAVIDNNIAWLLCRLDRCVQARTYYQRAGRRGDALQRSYAEAGVAHVELEVGDPVAAREQLELALEHALGSAEAPPPDLVAETRWHLAEALLRTAGPMDRATVLVGDALDFYRASGSDPLAQSRLEAMDRELRRR